MSAPLRPVEPPPETLIDLRGLAAGIRWRRRLWLALGVVGLLAGIALGTVLPSRASATARIYVVHLDEASGASLTAMSTDVALLQTTTVAAQALAKLGLPTAPEQFVTTYSGTAVAPNILEVTLRAPDNATALTQTQAVADGFVAVHVEQADAIGNAQADALKQLRDKTQKDLDDVTGQIKALGPSPDPAKAGPLNDKRSSLNAQIAASVQQAQQAGVGSPAVRVGTKIIDAPHVTSRSLLMSAATSGGIGMGMGLVLGLAVAAIAAVARRQPVLRADIAAHLGASVIAQIPAPLRGPRRLLSRSHAEKERGRAAATLARLVREDSGGVSLLELNARKAVTALAKDMASVLVEDSPVVLVDDLPGEGRGVLLDPVPQGVEIVDGAHFPPKEPLKASTRLLAVGSVSPGAPWTDLRRLAPETLLVVRAGSADDTWLHTVARQLADANIAIVGVVLIHPDARDRSDGTLWDALQVAVRGRLGSRPVPTAAVPTTVFVDGSFVQAMEAGERPPFQLATTVARVPVSSGSGAHAATGGSHPVDHVVDLPDGLTPGPAPGSHNGDDLASVAARGDMPGSGDASAGNNGTGRPAGRPGSAGIGSGRPGGEAGPVGNGSGSTANGCSGNGNGGPGRSGRDNRAPGEIGGVDGRTESRGPAGEPGPGPDTPEPPVGPDGNPSSVKGCTSPRSATPSPGSSVDSPTARLQPRRPQPRPCPRPRLDDQSGAGDADPTVQLSAVSRDTPPDRPEAT